MFSAMAEVRWGGVGLVCGQHGDRAVSGSHRDPVLEVAGAGLGFGLGRHCLWSCAIFLDLSSTLYETGDCGACFWDTGRVMGK